MAITGQTFKIRSKLTPSSADNYSPWEKQLLACFEPQKRLNSWSQATKLPLTWASHYDLGTIWFIKTKSWTCTGTFHHQRAVTYMREDLASPDSICQVACPSGWITPGPYSCYTAALSKSVPAVWLNDQGLRRNMIWKLMARRNHMNRSPWTSTICGDGCVTWTLNKDDACWRYSLLSAATIFLGTWNQGYSANCTE